MTSYPAMKIEAGFGSSPTNPSPTWTDITTYTRSADYSRGRQHDLDRFEPGTGSLLLNNRDRRFDPTNTAGPYYPNLVPGVRIRVTATWAAVDHVRFLGFVEKWDPQWPGGGQSDTVVEMADMLSLLATIDAPAGTWAIQIPTTTGLRAWWRLGEAAGATMAIDANNRFHGTYTAPGGKVDADGLIVSDPDKGALFAGSDSIVVNDHSVGTWLTDFSFVAAFSTVATTGTLFTERPFADGPAASVTVGLDGAGKLTATVDNSRFTSANTLSTSTATVTSPGTVNDGLPHTVALTRSGSTIVLYLDGVSVATSSALTAVPGARSGTVSIGSGWVGVIDEVAIFNSTLSSGTVATLAGDQKGLNGGAARLPRLLTWAGVDPADQNLDPLSYNTGELDPAFAPAGKVLALLQDLTAFQRALIFAAADGRITTRSRQAAWVSPGNTSQGTFSDSVTSTLPYTPVLSAPMDVRDVHNTITVGRSGGITYTAVDAASTVQNGVRDLTGFTNIPFATDLSAIDLANYLANQLGQPANRIDHIQMLGNAAPNTLYPQLLGREIGDRITVVRHPPGGGTWTTDQTIEGVADTLAEKTGKWVTTWRLSPYDATIYLVLDDTTSGVLDTAALAY